MIVYASWLSSVPIGSMKLAQHSSTVIWSTHICSYNMSGTMAGLDSRSGSVWQGIAGLVSRVGLGGIKYSTMDSQGGR